MIKLQPPPAATIAPPIAPPQTAATNTAAIKTALDKIKGGKAAGRKPSEFDSKELAKGIEEEKEHGPDKAIQKEIAMDHLAEDPKYYSKKKADFDYEPLTSAMAGERAYTPNSEAHAKLMRSLKEELFRSSIASGVDTATWLGAPLVGEHIGGRQRREGKPYSFGFPQILASATSPGAGYQLGRAKAYLKNDIKEDPTKSAALTDNLDRVKDIATRLFMSALPDLSTPVGVGLGAIKGRYETSNDKPYEYSMGSSLSRLIPGGTHYQLARALAHAEARGLLDRESPTKDTHDIWIGGKDPSITGKTAALNAFGVNAGISAALQAKRPMVQRGSTAMPTDVAAASAGLKQNNLYPSPAAAAAAPLELDLTPRTFEPGGNTLAWSSPAQRATMPLRHPQMSGRKFASVYERGIYAALEKFAALPLLAAAAPHLIRAGVGALAGGIGNKIQGGSFKGGLLPGAVGGVIPGIGGQVASMAAGALTNK